MRLPYLSLLFVLTARLPIFGGYADLPLSFEPNHGQAGRDVQYLARHGKLALYLTGGGLITSQGLQVGFAGARSGLRAAGIDRQAGVTNYLMGRDARRWRTSIPNYSRVQYRDVWPGIDVVFYGNAREVEFDFVVHPGARPDMIQLAFNRDVRLDAAGDLTTDDGYRQRRPVVYQETGAGRREIKGTYTLEGRRAGFKIESYDQRLPLVIDPVLSYSTYLGGSLVDEGWGIAVDGAGNAYVAGVTGLGFPTTGGALQTQCGSSTGCVDAFIAKLNPSGTALLFATYLGGAGDDRATALALDSTGVYVTGYTNSANFPGISPSVPGPFIVKLSLTGDQLLYASQMREANAEIAAVTVDTQGQAYIAGNRRGLGGISEGFIQRRSAGGGTMFELKTPNVTWNGFGSIAVDTNGNAYVAGTAHLALLGAVPGATQIGPGGGATDGFVMKTDDFGRVLYQAYIGGSGADSASGVAVDGTGNAYITGTTSSTDFRTTDGAFQSRVRGRSDVFVAKLDTTGALEFSTLIGGSGEEQGGGILVDVAGSAFVTGLTASSNFPLSTSTMQDRAGGLNDVFVAQVSPAGTALVYSTYLGGCYDEGLTGMALDRLENVYVTGYTGATNFPVTEHALKTKLTPALEPLMVDAFVSKIGQGAGTPFRSPCVVNAASYAARAVTPGELIAVFSPGDGPATGVGATVNSNGRIDTTLAGLTVLIDGIPSPLLFVRNDQVNAVVPFATRPGTTVPVQVTYNGSVVSTGSVLITEVAPAVFTADGSGQGGAAAMNQDGTLNSAANPAPAGSIVTVWATGIGELASAGVDGLITTGTPSRHVKSVWAKVDGKPAEVTYAGAAPMLVAGTSQLNIKIPDCATTGDNVALDVWAELNHDWAEQIPRVTIAVKPGPAACN